MNVLPVIARELCAQARNRRNFWLRLAGAAAAVGVVVLSVWRREFGLNEPEAGARLFVCLHAMMLAAIWLFVPALTADCIAREKREGTLGLLFLTPLTAREIVAGKCFVHALRALTLWLAAFPALTIPFLIGGVGRIDLVTASVIQLCSLALALAAGLLASSLAAQWVRALALAEVLAFILATLLGISAYLIFGLEAGDLVPQATWSELTLGDILGDISLLIFGSSTHSYGSSPGWSALFAQLSPGADTVWLHTLGEIAFLCALVTLWIVFYAARSVEQHWRETPLTTRQLWWREFFFAPRFWQKFFRSRLKRQLERNPIGWLQQRSVGARLMKWGWCLGVLNVELLWARSFPELQNILAVVIIIGIASAASLSYRRERQTGALELLITTTLSTHQIIAGRLRAIYAAFFLPATTILVYFAALRFAGWLDWENVTGIEWENITGIISFSWVFGSCFVIVPLYGMNCALRIKNAVAAWFVTCLFAGSLALALLMASIMVHLFSFQAFLRFFDLWPKMSEYPNLILGICLDACGYLLAVAIQVFFARRLWTLLHQGLSSRVFFRD